VDEEGDDLAAQLFNNISMMNNQTPVDAEQEEAEDNILA
jgi:hypothetical protein